MDSNRICHVSIQTHAPKWCNCTWFVLIVCDASGIPLCVWVYDDFSSKTLSVWIYVFTNVTFNEDCKNQTCYHKIIFVFFSAEKAVEQRRIPVRFLNNILNCCDEYGIISFSVAFGCSGWTTDILVECLDLEKLKIDSHNN